MEDAAPKLAAMGVPLAGLDGGVADLLGKLAERAREVNEGLHTNDHARLAELLARS